MPDNDFNIIKPVENLHNIAGLTPANPRQEKKRRQTAQRNDRSGNNSTDDRKQQAKNDFAADKDDNHSIDYRA
jgi:hypothetical protein